MKISKFVLENDHAGCVAMTLFEQPIEPLFHGYELFDFRILTDWDSDAVDSLSGICEAGIRNEEDLFFAFIFSRYIEQHAVWTSPNCVELAFNQNAWPLPNLPANDGRTAEFSNVLCSCLKAFSGTCIGPCDDLDKNRLTWRGNPVAQCADMLIDTGRRGRGDHGFMSPNDRIQGPSPARGEGPLE